MLSSRPLQELGSDGKTSIVTGIANGTTSDSNGQLGIAAGQQSSSRRHRPARRPRQKNQQQP